MSIVEIVGDIAGETAVSAGVAAEIKTIDPNLAIAIDAVKTDDEPLARVRRGDGKMFPVPTNAGGRIVTANRLVAMRHDVGIGGVFEGQFDGPVMGKRDVTPVVVIEIGGDGGAFGLAGFREDGDGAEIEIFGGVGGVAQMEFPALVQSDVWRGEGSREVAPGDAVEGRVRGGRPVRVW